MYKEGTWEKTTVVYNRLAAMRRTQDSLQSRYKMMDI
jgi:hypothetical protein